MMPRLPNDYQINCSGPYRHNGYLFNLDAGEYTIIVTSYGQGMSPKPNDGKKWLIRAVSSHATLQKL